VLVLTRKSDEGIIIDNDIRIVVVEIRDKTVRLGIDAPAGRSIHREEVYKKIQAQNRAASMVDVKDISMDHKGVVRP